jgi:hypothetical protein
MAQRTGKIAEHDKEEHTGSYKIPGILPTLFGKDNKTGHFGLQGLPNRRV